MPSESDQFASMLDGLTAAGLSMAAIAQRSGLSRGMLYRIRNGDLREPLLSSYIKLGRAYQTTTHQPPPPLDFRR